MVFPAVRMPFFDTVCGGIVCRSVGLSFLFVFFAAIVMDAPAEMPMAIRVRSVNISVCI